MSFLLPSLPALLPADPPSDPQIPLDAVTVGGTDLGITEDQVVIDTGTTLIGMPTAAVDTIYAQIPNAQSIDLDGESGYWCGSFLLLSLLPYSEN
jgi:hypothetical protein